jgi:hypothetical protein
MNAQTPGPARDLPERSASALRRTFATWPRRIGAIVGSALLAWAVAQFAPALWEEASERTGLAPASLQVEVVMDPDLIETAGGLYNPEFIVQRSIAEVGPPPNGDDEQGRYRWAKEMGAVDAFATVLRLVIRGRSESPVTLHGLEVEVVERRPPLPGTLLTYSGQGAGQDVRHFTVQLDKEPSTVKYVTDEGAEEVPFPYRVSQTELEVFDIFAYSLQDYVEWRLRLAYTDDEGAGTMVIDDGGKPFQTTAHGGSDPLPGQRHYFWADGAWVG